MSIKLFKSLPDFEGGMLLTGLEDEAEEAQTDKINAINTKAK